ncbi:MAG: hypothetical protein R6T98_15955 [Desulfatiglandales bacterium]
MIGQHMKLHRSLSTAKRGPRKQRHTQGYSGAVQGKQFVFKPECLFSWGGTLANSKGVREEISKQFPGSMGIDTGQGGFVRGISHAWMPELPQTTGKSPAYLSEALGLD